MKRKIVLTTLVIVFAMTLAATVASAPPKTLRTTAQPEDAAACSLVGAAGTYGFNTSGTVIGVGPRVSAGIITLDAAGNVTGKATSSLNGVVAGETFAGTYMLNSECIGTFSIGVSDLAGNPLFNAKLNFVSDDNMRESRFIFTSIALPNGTALATVITGTSRKLGGQ